MYAVHIPLFEIAHFFLLDLSFFGFFISHSDWLLRMPGQYTIRHTLNEQVSGLSSKWYGHDSMTDDVIQKMIQKYHDQKQQITNIQRNSNVV